MPVSREQAEGAIKALKALSRPQVKQLTMANSHMFDKHVGKAAAEGDSWFEKVSDVGVTSIEQFKGLPDNRKKKILAVAGMTSKKLAQTLRENETENKYDPKVYTLVGATTDIGVNGVPDLMYLLLQQPVLGLFVAFQRHPNGHLPSESYFTLVVDIPGGYVGRDGGGGGGKTKLVDPYVKMIIQAPSPAQIVTAYPVSRGMGFGPVL